MFSFKKLNSTFIKIVTVFIISLLPLYILIGYVLTNDYRIIQNEVVNSKNLSINFYTKSVFDDMEKALNQMYQLLNSNDMKKFILNNENENYKYINKLELCSRIQEQIVNISISNKYIKDIKIWINDGSILTDTAVNYDKEENAKWVKKFSDNRKNILYDKETKKLYLIASSPAFAILGTENPSAIAFIEVSTENIRDFVSEYCSISKEYGSVELIASGDGLITDDNGKINQAQINFLLKSDKKTVNPLQLHQVHVNDKTIWTASNESTLMGMKIIFYLNKLPIENPIKRLMILYIVLTILTVFIIKIDWDLIRNIVATPVDMLVNAFKKSEGTEYTEITEGYRNDEFGYIFSKFNSLVAELRNNISMVYEQKMRAQEAEFKHLQVQINPHFLYNSIFTISRLAKDGNMVLVSKFADHLGNYFRYITKTGIELVPLEEEFEHAKNYIDIMSMRFYNRVTVFIDDKLKNRQFIVPKLIIQPLIENAFEHGMKDVLTDGEIHISLADLNFGLCITVEDNGELYDTDIIDKLNDAVNQQNEPINMTGLSNVNKRLKIYFGEESGLKFSVSSYGGLRVDIIIIQTHNPKELR